MDEQQKTGEELTIRDALAIERNDLAIERNDLAIERNELANERTVLSYARTSIMSFLTGVTMFKLFPHILAMEILGWISIVIAVVIIITGLRKFVVKFRSLKRAHARRSTHTRPHERV
jgi:putative membrane protein